MPAPHPPAPRLVVVMGPAGAGKSTLGRALAASLACSFVEGDDHHPPANRAKMAAGIALIEADRTPWLASLGTELAARSAGGVWVVGACSALRRAHRDQLRGRAGPIQLVLLQAERAVLAARLAERRNHFMPPALVDSQLALLEEPGVDEDCLLLSATQPLEALVETCLGWLGAAA